MAGAAQTPRRRAIDGQPLSPADEAACAAWRQMAVTFLKWQRRVEELLAPHGLVFSQFEALAKVSKTPGIIQQDLVGHLLVTKGNVGALLDRLEKLDLLARRPDPKDRRANRLFLTAKGGELVDAVLREHRANVCEMMRPLSVAERRSLESLLRAVEPE